MKVNRVGIRILPAHSNAKKNRRKHKARKAAFAELCKPKKEKAVKRPSMRSRLFDSAGGKCHYCGSKLIGWNEAKNSKKKLVVVPPTQRATVDHKVPVSKGGRSDDANLILSCERCNRLKADKPYEQFVRDFHSLISFS